MGVFASESRDGDPVRRGSSWYDGAGGVQRRDGEHRRGGAADTGEAERERFCRVAAVFLSGSLHLPHPSLRWHHVSLYGQRHLRE